MPVAKKAASKKTTAKKTATRPDPDEGEEELEEEVRATGTAVVDWEEQMRLDAEASQKMEESTATGAFFSTKAGQLSWSDSPVENNQMAAIIIDSVLENVSYDGDYDDDAPKAPTCFAFGRLETEMAPHEAVVALGQQINDACTGCERNKFGSADVGRGKACRNIRRLAIIPAGKLDGNGKFTPDKGSRAYSDSAMGFLKLNVMSVKGYSAYIKQVNGALKRPGYGVFTKIKIVPDTKSQFRITFEPLGLVPPDLMPAIKSRVDEARASIMQPYNLEFEEAPPKPTSRGRQATNQRNVKGKPAAKAPAGRRKF